MNIEQLESYNLGDAIKFHDTLNPLLWDKGEHLKPEIKDHLLKIAADFGEFLGVDDIALKDVTISGSNAAYNYTPGSDIDLHLVVEFPEGNDVYRELFNAKKTLYNSEHKITVKGIPVELYAQSAAEKHISQGIYSLLHNDWVEIPRRKKADIDDISVKSKFEEFETRAKQALKHKSGKEINELIKKIHNMRKSGLDAHGEFGPENLAFKMLRGSGIIKKLYDARNDIKSKELSLKEKVKNPTTYGFGSDQLDEVGITPDGTNPTTSEFTNEEQLDEVGVTPDGVSASTCMFANEGQEDEAAVVRDFAQFCVDNLRLETPIKLRLKKDPAWSERNKTFGRYNGETSELEVSIAGRHLMDVLRTIAHELTHQRQHEREEVPAEAGETGSAWENEANARAGILMREYGHAHPELFDTLAESSGYIPTAAQAHDPRFEMALTNDVRPGATGKAANAFLLNTDAQGHPQELRPDGLVKRMFEEYKRFKA